MLEINLDPTLITLGPLVITWHGVFTAVGVLAGILLAVRLGAERGFSEDDILSVALWSVIGGILGARILHIIDQWSYYAQDPMAILRINEGGLAIFGSVVFGPLVGAIYCKWRGFSIPRLLDIGTPPLVLGMAIGRIGDIINGEHHGAPAGDFPLSVRYTHPNTLGELDRSVHLAVGYEMLLDLAILALLLRWRWKLPHEGMMFWTFAALYSFGRFFVTFYRQDTIFAFNLTQAQVMSFLVGAAAVWVMIFQAARARRRTAEHRASESSSVVDEAG
jgi:phosphatidylglycerol:prolipoprotein diacylglycerol transferase